MKKLLLALFFTLHFSLITFHSQSQTCTPDPSFTVSGIYPDSLPHAIVNHPYSGTLQVRVPSDTTALVNGNPTAVTIDSAVIKQVLGLPANFTYGCNPVGCQFLGGSNGCANFYSTSNPTVGMVGNYPLQIFVTTYGHVTGFPFLTATQNDTITKYHITIDMNTGVSTIAAPKYGAGQNHPNPFKTQTVIDYYSATTTITPLKVANILGKTVFLKQVEVNAGLNNIIVDAKDFLPGIYFYTIGNSTHRMIVEAK